MIIDDKFVKIMIIANLLRLLKKKKSERFDASL